MTHRSVCTSTLNPSHQSASASLRLTPDHVSVSINETHRVCISLNVDYTPEIMYQSTVTHSHSSLHQYASMQTLQTSLYQPQWDSHQSASASMRLTPVCISLNETSHQSASASTWGSHQSASASIRLTPVCISTQWDPHQSASTLFTELTSSIIYIILSSSKGLFPLSICHHHSLLYFYQNLVCHYFPWDKYI